MKAVSDCLTEVGRNFESIYSLQELGVDQVDPNIISLVHQLRRMSSEFADTTNLVTGRIQSKVIAPSKEYSTSYLKFKDLHKKRKALLLDYQYTNDKFERHNLKQTNNQKYFQELEMLQQKTIHKRREYEELTEISKVEHRTILQQTFPIYDIVLHNLILELKEFSHAFTNTTNQFMLTSMNLHNAPVVVAPTAIVSKNLPPVPVIRRPATTEQVISTVTTVAEPVAVVQEIQYVEQSLPVVEEQHVERTFVEPLVEVQQPIQAETQYMQEIQQPVEQVQTYESTTLVKPQHVETTPEIVHQVPVNSHVQHPMGTSREESIIPLNYV
ncbi:hypothetical protein AKO1_007958 [Acrasis kona]|uniref:BAR domain-containing protein n=1 Tax=Acrasis kona TaxID=1008807 RepID=A0AAW2YQC0_9EUKA